MKITKETEVEEGFVDLEIDLTDKEEANCLDIAKHLVPGETDRDTQMQAALEYLFVLLIVEGKDG